MEPILTLMNKDNSEPLRKWRAQQTVEELGVGELNTEEIQVGELYKISYVGDSDFVSVGAESNDVGVIFTATGVPTGTGTVLKMRVNYNVRADDLSDFLYFNIWNNKRVNETIDLTIVEGVTNAGSINIRIDGVDHTVAVSENLDTNQVASQIKSAIEVDLTGWSVEILEKIEVDAKIVRDTIIVFTSGDYLEKGSVSLNVGTTGMVGNIRKLLVGNPSTEEISRITDAKVVVRAFDGGIESDVVKKKWFFMKDERSPSFINLGVDDDGQGFNIEHSLTVSANDTSVAAGQIMGNINDNGEADSANYASMTAYVHPHFNVTQGLRPFKIVLTYNFT